MLSGFCPARFRVSAVSCSAADTHLKLLDRMVSSASFWTWGMLKCDLAHHPSVSVLCMLYKIRCIPMHPLCGVLPLPYVPVRVIRGAWIAHRYTYATPRCRKSQYRRTFILLAVSLWNNLGDLVWDWRVSRAGPMPFFGLATACLFVSYWFPFLFFHSIGWHCGTGLILRTIGC